MNISNRELIDELVLSKFRLEACPELGSKSMTPTLEDMLATMIEKTSTRYGTRNDFGHINYAKGVLRDCWHKFDVQNSNNPFAYFTNVIYLALRKYEQSVKEPQRFYTIGIQ